MSTHQAGRISSRTKDLDALCGEVEDDVRKHQKALAITLRAAAEPAVQLPEALMLLDQQGRGSSAGELGKLVQAIAKDWDVFSAQKVDLDGQLEELLSKRPKKKSHLSSHSNKVQWLGHQYISLANVVAQNLMTMVDAYYEILEPSTEAEVVS